jgi:hypothetical protein
MTRILMGTMTVLLATACATGPGNQRATLFVSMSGIQEIPGPGDTDGNGRSQGCATVDQEVAREMSMAAQNFYVNVHTAAHPAGAIRGQLRGGPEAPQRMQPNRRY